MDPNRKISKKFTKKFGSKVTNRQYFHRKTGLEFKPMYVQIKKRQAFKVSFSNMSKALDYLDTWKNITNWPLYVVKIPDLTQFTF